MPAYRVTLNGEEIDTVYDQETDPQEVRRSLVDHDGFDPGITVELAESFAGFVKRNRITISTEQVDSNPHMEDSDWRMDHWKCIFRMGRKRFTLYFSMGSGHQGAEPTAAEVLECLRSDSTGDFSSFDNWASDYGYDTDSRRALKTYQATKRQTAKLRQFLGAEFDNLLRIED